MAYQRNDVEELNAGGDSENFLYVDFLGIVLGKELFEGLNEWFVKRREFNRVVEQVLDFL